MDEAQIIPKYAFLECEDGAILFSQLVDALKRGAHIQYEGDKALFLYLNKHIDTLSAYFEDMRTLLLFLPAVETNFIISHFITLYQEIIILSTVHLYLKNISL